MMSLFRHFEELSVHFVISDDGYLTDQTVCVCQGSALSFPLLNLTSLFLALGPACMHSLLETQA